MQILDSFFNLGNFSFFLIKKRKALDDQTKSDLQQKDSKQKTKKRKALDDQTTSNLRQKDSKQKAKKKEKLPKLKKLSRICMNQTDKQIK
jgi:hypothetical protein